MLDREEYVEQAHLFKVLGERMPENVPLQDLLAQIREEVLVTTKLPLAMDFLLSELKHIGSMAPAMERLKHYFTPFQTYVIHAAEDERSRFDIRVAVEVLRNEANYRATAPTRQGVFLYQFETLCRNRMKYDPGLLAIAQDPIFDDDWREWIMDVRRQIGILDLADMIYVRSQHYLTRQAKAGREEAIDRPVLFGENEGRIALANRRKDPLYLFAALQRQLGYPGVPRPKKMDETPQLLPQMQRRLERLESRIKLLEDEQKGGFDLTKFYGPRPPKGLIGDVADFE